MASRILSGRYELLEKIGDGGMAVVYKGKDKLLNRFIAVKILRPEFTKDTTITVQAEDDWIMAVNTSPTSMPVKVFLVKNSSISLSLAPAAFSMLSLIIFMPRRKSPRPPNSDNRVAAFIISCLYVLGGF